MGREKFSALDMLSKRSLPERKEKQAIIYKDPRELVPTQENFYTTKNISKLQGVDKDHRVPDAANSDRECRWRR